MRALQVPKQSVGGGERGWCERSAGDQNITGIRYTSNTQAFRSHLKHLELGGVRRKVRHVDMQLCEAGIDDVGVRGLREGWVWGFKDIQRCASAAAAGT